MRRKRKRKAGVPPATQGDAFVAIADEGGDGALKLVGDIMERNRVALDASLDLILEDEKQEHNMTRIALRDAKFHLNDMQERVAWLMGGPMPESLRVEIEQLIEAELDTPR